VKTNTMQDRRTATLVDLLNELAAGQRDLLAVIEAKIVAMRQGNPEAIREATLREQAVVVRMTERESLRRQLAVNIARGYGVGADAARRMSAAQLADRIGGSEGGRIRRAAEELKTLTRQVTSRNHVAELIAQNVLRHVKIAFESITGGVREALGYSPIGHTYAGGRERILDAVG